jgi:hypothetical protein
LQSLVRKLYKVRQHIHDSSQVSKERPKVINDKLEIKKFGRQSLVTLMRAHLEPFCEHEVKQVSPYHKGPHFFDTDRKRQWRQPTPAVMHPTDPKMT